MTRPPDTSELINLLRGVTTPTNSTTPHTYTVRGAGEFIKPIEFATLPEPAPRVDLVQDLLPKDLITILYGDGANAKSYLAMILAFHIVLGWAFVGIPTTQANVLYVDWELDVSEQGRRAYKVARGMRLKQPPPGFSYLQAEQPLSGLATHLANYVKKAGIGMVIIDSFGAACGGDSEQSGFVIPIMNQLRNLGATVLILDHQAKTQEGQSYGKKTPFGSAYKFNLARSVIQTQKVASSPGKLSLLLRPTKFNLGYLKEEHPLLISFGEDSVSIETTDPLNNADFWSHMPAREKILHNLRTDGPGTAKELAERIGIKQATITNEIGRLKEKGLVVHQGKNGNAPICALANSTTPQPIYMYGDGEKSSSGIEPQTDLTINYPEKAMVVDDI